MRLRLFPFHRDSLKRAINACHIKFYYDKKETFHRLTSILHFYKESVMKKCFFSLVFGALVTTLITASLSANQMMPPQGQNGQSQGHPIQGENRRYMPPPPQGQNGQSQGHPIQGENRRYMPPPPQGQNGQSQGHPIQGENRRYMPPPPQGQNGQSQGHPIQGENRRYMPPPPQGQNGQFQGHPQQGRNRRFRGPPPRRGPPLEQMDEPSGNSNIPYTAREP